MASNTSEERWRPVYDKLYGKCSISDIFFKRSQLFALLIVFFHSLDLQILCYVMLGNIFLKSIHSFIRELCSKPVNFNVNNFQVFKKNIYSKNNFLNNYKYVICINIYYII